jgi:hypothetical protein
MSCFSYKLLDITCAFPSITVCLFDHFTASYFLGCCFYNQFSLLGGYHEGHPPYSTNPQEKGTDFETAHSDANDPNETVQPRLQMSDRLRKGRSLCVRRPNPRSMVGEAGRSGSRKSDKLDDAEERKWATMVVPSTITFLTSVSFPVLAVAAGPDYHRHRILNVRIWRL